MSHNKHFTMKPYVDWLIDRVDVKGKTVLEPSAGDGNFVKAALEAGAEHVTAIELCPDEAAKIPKSDKVTVIVGRAQDVLGE